MFILPPASASAQPCPATSAAHRLLPHQRQELALEALAGHSVSVRSFALLTGQRINWLAVGSPRGGRTAAVLFSIPSTCQRLDRTLRSVEGTESLTSLRLRVALPPSHRDTLDRAIHRAPGAPVGRRPRVSRRRCRRPAGFPRYREAGGPAVAAPKSDSRDFARKPARNAYPSIGGSSLRRAVCRG
jgi:hypothetical protein